MTKLAPHPPLSREDLDHIVAHTQGLWDDLRGQAIFLTGGTGFFGAWLLESFAYVNERLNLGARVHVLTRQAKAFALKMPHLVSRGDLEFIEGDIRDFAFPQGSFSFVIHAAAPFGGQLAPLEILDTIVNGTRRVLDFAAARGTRKLLFTSSGAIYGRQPSELTHIPEDYAGAPEPLDSRAAYGEGKRVGELMCGLMARKHRFEAKVVRCFAFVGPHLPLDAQFASGNFIRDALNGGPIRVNGDGMPYRSYLYAADLAIWLWTILFRGETCRPYNVGSEESITIRHLAKVVADQFQAPLEIKIAGESKAGASPDRYVPAVKRAMNELGLTQRISLSEAIHKTISSLRIDTTTASEPMSQLNNQELV